MRISKRVLYTFYLLLTACTFALPECTNQTAVFRNDTSLTIIAKFPPGLTCWTLLNVPQCRSEDMKTIDLHEQAYLERTVAITSAARSPLTIDNQTDGKNLVEFTWNWLSISRPEVGYAMTSIMITSPLPQVNITFFSFTKVSGDAIIQIGCRSVVRRNTTQPRCGNSTHPVVFKLDERITSSAPLLLWTVNFGTYGCIFQFQCLNGRAVLQHFGGFAKNILRYTREGQRTASLFDSWILGSANEPRGRITWPTPTVGSTGEIFPIGLPLTTDSKNLDFTRMKNFNFSSYLSSELMFSFARYPESSPAGITLQLRCVKYQCSAFNSPLEIVPRKQWQWKSFWDILESESEFCEIIIEKPLCLEGEGVIISVDWQRNLTAFHSMFIGDQAYSSPSAMDTFFFEKPISFQINFTLGPGNSQLGFEYVCSKIEWRPRSTEPTVITPVDPQRTDSVMSVFSDVDGAGESFTNGSAVLNWELQCPSGFMNFSTFVANLSMQESPPHQAQLVGSAGTYYVYHYYYYTQLLLSFPQHASTLVLPPESVGARRHTQNIRDPTPAVIYRPQLFDMDFICSNLTQYNDKSPVFLTPMKITFRREALQLRGGFHASAFCVPSQCQLGCSPSLTKPITKDQPFVLQRKYKAAENTPENCTLVFDRPACDFGEGLEISIDVPETLRRGSVSIFDYFYPDPDSPKVFLRPFSEVLDGFLVSLRAFPGEWIEVKLTIRCVGAAPQVVCGKKPPPQLTSREGVIFSDTDGHRLQFPSFATATTCVPWIVDCGAFFDDSFLVQFHRVRGNVTMSVGQQVIGTNTLGQPVYQTVYLRDSFRIRSSDHFSPFFPQTFPRPNSTTETYTTKIFDITDADPIPGPVSVFHTFYHGTYHGGITAEYSCRSSPCSVTEAMLEFAKNPGSEKWFFSANQRAVQIVALSVTSVDRLSANTVAVNAPFGASFTLTANESLVPEKCVIQFLPLEPSCRRSLVTITFDKSMVGLTRSSIRINNEQFTPSMATLLSFYQVTEQPNKTNVILESISGGMLNFTYKQECLSHNEVNVSSTCVWAVSERKDLLNQTTSLVIHQAISPGREHRCIYNWSCGIRNTANVYVRHYPGALSSEYIQINAYKFTGVAEYDLVVPPTEIGNNITAAALVILVRTASDWEIHIRCQNHLTVNAAERQCQPGSRNYPQCAADCDDICKELKTATDTTANSVLNCVCTSCLIAAFEPPACARCRNIAYSPETNCTSCLSADGVFPSCKPRRELEWVPKQRNTTHKFGICINGNIVGAPTPSATITEQINVEATSKISPTLSRPTLQSGSLVENPISSTLSRLITKDIERSIERTKTVTPSSAAVTTKVTAKTQQNNLTLSRTKTVTTSKRVFARNETIILMRDEQGNFPNEKRLSPLLKNAAGPVVALASITVFAVGLVTPGLAAQGTRAAFTVSVSECAFNEEDVGESIVVFPIQPKIAVGETNVNEAFQRLNGAVLCSSIIYLLLPCAILVGLYFSQHTSNELKNQSPKNATLMKNLSHVWAAASGYFSPNVFRIGITLLNRSPQNHEMPLKLLACIAGVAIPLITAVIVPWYFLFPKFGAIEQTPNKSREETPEPISEQNVTETPDDGMAKEEAFASRGGTETVFVDKLPGNRGFVVAFGPLFDGNKTTKANHRIAYLVEILSTLLVCGLSGIRPTDHCQIYAFVMLIAHLGYIAYLALVRPMACKYEALFVNVNAGVQLLLLIVVVIAAVRESTEGIVGTLLAWQILFSTVILFCGGIVFLSFSVLKLWNRVKLLKKEKERAIEMEDDTLTGALLQPVELVTEEQEPKQRTTVNPLIHQSPGQ